MEKKPSISSRPNSGSEKKKMEIINPRQAKKDPVPKSKTISSKKLEKVSNSVSPSTTLTDFSFAKPISASEKQHLELLTSDPLNFNILDSELESDDRSDKMKFLQNTLESMQALNQERENEEIYERLVDTLKYSEASERMEKMQKIQQFAEQLRNQKDDMGNNLIEFPPDFDEMVEVAVEYRKNNNKDEVNWIQVFESKNKHEATDEAYRKKRENIRKLDLVLKEKEKVLKELRNSRESARSKSSVSETSDKGSVFITKVKTKAEVKQKTSTENFIKKNIEYVEEYKGGYSMTEKLSRADRERLAIIEEKLDVIEEYNGILPVDSVNRLEEIDRALRNYIPQIKWEEKSVNSGQYSHGESESSKQEKKKVLPGDPVLREAQERREAVQELQSINSKLLEIQNRPIRPLTDDEVTELLLETGYDFDQKRTSPATKDREEILIEEANECIQNIRNLENLDFDEVIDIVAEAENNMAKYLQLAESQRKELENDEEYKKIKHLFTEKCDSQIADCSKILEKIESIEKKIQKEREIVENEENIEREILSEVKFPEIKEPTIEEIDQEIQAKIEDSFKAENSSFPDMDDINPENYPTLYYMYEKVLQQEVTSGIEFK